MTACFPVKASGSWGRRWPQHRQDYRNSPFFLDWLLLSWLTDGHPSEDVKDFVPAMDERQYQLYLRLTERFQELLRKSDRSYFLLEAGKRLFWQGEHGDAIVCLQRGWIRPTGSAA